MKMSKAGMFRDVGLSCALPVLATLLGGAFHRLGLHDTNIVVVYIFSVMLVARFTKGYAYGAFASAASLLLFNWFFTEPYYTLKVNDMTYLITFAIMLLTSVLTSALTTKVMQAADEARERERESNALYQMTNHLTDAEDAEAIATIVVKAVGDVLECATAFVCFDEQGEPEKSFVQRREDGGIVRRELADGEQLRRRMEQLHRGAEVTDEDYIYPVCGKSDVLAVLRVPCEVGAGMSEAQTRMLHSIMESAAMALERMRSLQAQARSREETLQERYRSNLLRAISHDIRTPLSAIMGTSEMLMDAMDGDARCVALAEDIYRDAGWLHDMVENILNLTRLQDGGLSLNKQPEAVEEVIGAALLTAEKRMPGRRIELEMPAQVLMVPMDARLISQVLLNLLDNAGKHTRQEAEITVAVTVQAAQVSITVADRGSGIAPGDLPHIFKMFYTTESKSSDAGRGVGLGLAICQSVVEAHGGTIRAENREGGGAAFTFTLPKESEEV